MDSSPDLFGIDVPKSVESNFAGGVRDERYDDRRGYRKRHIRDRGVEQAWEGSRDTQGYARETPEVLLEPGECQGGNGSLWLSASLGPRDPETGASGGAATSSHGTAVRSEEQDGSNRRERHPRSFQEPGHRTGSGEEREAAIDSGASSISIDVGGNENRSHQHASRVTSRGGHLHPGGGP